MAQTNQQIITESFQILGVVREGRQPTPTQSSNGMTILNDNLLTQMRDGWGNIGWYPQTIAQLNSLAPLKDEDIAANFPKGHRRIKPYLRYTPQPNK